MATSEGWGGGLRILISDRATVLIKLSVSILPQGEARYRGESTVVVRRGRRYAATAHLNGTVERHNANCECEELGPPVLLYLYILDFNFVYILESTTLDLVAVTCSCLEVALCTEVLSTVP